MPGLTVFWLYTPLIQKVTNRFSFSFFQKIRCSFLVRYWKARSNQAISLFVIYEKHEGRAKSAPLPGRGLTCVNSELNGQGMIHFQFFIGTLLVIYAGLSVNWNENNFLKTVFCVLFLLFSLEHSKFWQSRYLHGSSRMMMLPTFYDCCLPSFGSISKRYLYASWLMKFEFHALDFKYKTS